MRKYRAWLTAALIDVYKRQLLGKPVHSDEKNEKTTWVTVYGLEQAKKDVAEYSEEAMAILAQMTGVTEPEKSFLYDFVESVSYTHLHAFLRQHLKSWMRLLRRWKTEICLLKKLLSCIRKA